MQSFRPSTVRTAAVIAFLGCSALSSHAGPTMQKHPSAQPAAKAVAAIAARAAGATAAKAVAAVHGPKDLHKKMRWVPVRQGGKTLRTLDEASRLMLARSAADHAGLASVGLMGRNGVASVGLAQFEPATAKGLGLQDPNDPVQAVHAAAVYMKHGAEWASRKIAHLKLSPQERAAKLREGVSVYYNLSVRGRNKWDGINTASLPVETQRHIANVRTGAQEALQLAGQFA
ncbi:hypothetical protein H8N03_12675 [Ramlibacter sp. USB13]|uniref:Lytic transglycosylase domain-containing protein n=1 Tax=Ramlibacter cellulosilyticus TaxID=2764187 RepID=A0A923MRD3_9BURK|nr:hypothetical protein [Ramlibacter cellulosilyticus]MBC5783803.1 hypothetical protein [Ramlibacter cellulosilyticus]